jgi:hypothetical protein
MRYRLVAAFAVPFVLLISAVFAQPSADPCLPTATPVLDCSYLPVLLSGESENAIGDFLLSPSTQEVVGSPGASAQFFITVQNQSGDTVNNVRLVVTTTIPGYEVFVLPSVNLERMSNNDSRAVTLFIRLPSGRPIDERNTIRLLVMDGNGLTRAAGVYTVRVIAPTPTLQTPTLQPDPS